MVGFDFWVNNEEENMVELVKVTNHFPTTYVRQMGADTTAPYQWRMRMVAPTGSQLFEALWHYGLFEGLSTKEVAQEVLKFKEIAL